MLKCLRFLLICLFPLAAAAQPATYIDEDGIMRWSASQEIVCVFGTNYAPPFAYWEARAPIGADQKQAIDEDVYHIARLGLDGYRIHVWPSYISDDHGNLIANEHLDLFDYLLFKLKARGIKLFITPMYLSGGPSGFPKKYGGKNGCLSNPDAFPAQANYLAQFVSHVNPYTGIAYKDDPDLLGFEIVNEPAHFKKPELIAPYIEQMVQAIRATGCENPLFYNMTTTASFVDQILPTDVQGGTFQWYPTGLTANHDLTGNLLPNVDQYIIPFADQLDARKLPKFVYEFSPSDVGASAPLYPAMARSFREAGFQFAAHFAYDPMHAAYCNIAYRTHFMNLAYTPKKAIGLMIASEAFHQVPLDKSYGRFPENNDFESFHLSYEKNLAEKVTADSFLYSNTTNTQPPSPATLQKIAGTGSSPIVTYSGSGVYMLDRLEAGVWRLELMPDAIWVKDPFYVPHIEREPAVIQWKSHPMTLHLPDLGAHFTIQGLNDGNRTHATAEQSTFHITPGSYLLTRAGKTSAWQREDTWNNIQLKEFHAPSRPLPENSILHTPPTEVCIDQPLTLTTTIVTSVPPTNVELIILGIGRGERLPMQPTGAYEYSVQVPPQFLSQTGLLRYHISTQLGDATLTAPSMEFGAHLLERRIYSDDRNFAEGEPYSIRVVPSHMPITLFDAQSDWATLTKMHRKDRIDRLPATIPGKSLLHLRATQLSKPPHDFSVRSDCRSRIQHRATDLANKQHLVIHGHALDNRPCTVQIALTTTGGIAYGATVTLSPETHTTTLALKDLQRVPTVLLPRPYPSFHRYFFDSQADAPLDLTEVESLQISIGPGLSDTDYATTHGAAIGWITLH